MVSLISSIIGIVTGLVAVITTYYLFLKYIYAPKFLIGVIPILPNDKIGKPSSIDEFYFNKKYLSQKISSFHSVDKIKKDCDKVRIYNKRGKIELPIIIQNIGKREAERYKIAISFSDPQVKIFGFYSETLQIDGLYAQKSNLITDKKLQKKNVPAKIRKYWNKIGLTSDYISLTGSLASKASEMILLEVEVPVLEGFFINFRIDSPSILSKREVFTQYIKTNEPT